MTGLSNEHAFKPFYHGYYCLEGCRYSCGQKLTLQVVRHGCHVEWMPVVLDEGCVDVAGVNSGKAWCSRHRRCLMG